MLPLRLEIRNFLAYSAPDPLRFEGMHLACLTGPNGAGKSSLLDAITWALWGQARARRDEELIRQGEQDMYVQLDFEQEGTVYRVVRRRTRKQRGTGTLDLYAKVDGEWNTLNEPSMRATQDRINRLLRLDYETFIHSAFLLQGKADAFTTKQPRERKQILTDILGLAQWEEYEEAAKDRFNAVKGELDQIGFEIARIDQELQQEPALQQARVEAEAAHETARAALEAADAAVKELADTPANLRNARIRHDDAARRVQTLESDRNDASDALERQRARVAEYAQIVDQRTEIEAGYAALQQAREADDALADKLRRLRDFDDEQRALERQIAEARAALEADARAEDTRIESLERTAARATREDYDDVQAEIGALRGLETERDELRETIVTLNAERAGCSEANRSLRVEMNAIKDRLDRLEAAPEAAAECPLCGQPLPPERRAALLDELRADGTQRGDLFRANEARVKAIGSELDDLRERIDELDRSLRRLPPLIERAGALEMQVRDALEAETQLSEARARLDALRARLDAADYAPEAHQRLAELEAERAAIGYDRASHDSARQQLADYHEFERRHTELEFALGALPAAQDELERATERQTQAEIRLSEAQQEIAALAQEIEALAALDEELRAREAAADALRREEQNAWQQLINIRQELNALDTLRRRRVELETSAAQKRHEQGLYAELRKAFGKDGIPTMIIEAAIPELEAGANDLLRRMTGGRMNLRIDTQRDNVTGGQRETLDFLIADELGTRSYELYSGGEAFRINFALRVALSQLLARRAGAHLRTLFLDEGFGTQDAEGRDRLVEAITAVQDSFDLILVITHIDELRDSFPVHLIVEKASSGSRIAVR